MLGFLLKPRWLGLLAFVVAFGLVCFQLGFWQLERHFARIDRNEAIRAAFATPAVPLDDVVKANQDVEPSDEWIRVSVSGTYDAARSATVKYRVRENIPGAEIVVPLRLDDGTAVLVNRGWVETESRNKKPTVPSPPAGQVNIEGWLRPNNQAGGKAVRLSDGQIRAIDSVGFSESVPYDLRSGYLNLRTEQPRGTPAPAKEPKPDLSQGVHFFYALQWWFFALIGIVGYSSFAVSEYRERRAARAAESRGAEPPGAELRGAHDQASETRSR